MEGAALVKDEPGLPGCATFTFHMTIKEEPECASSAGCASGTGAAREAEARVQHEPDVCGVYRPLVGDGFAWLKRGGVTAGAEHGTEPHNVIAETVQHTAETHSYKCDACAQIFLQKQCLIDHVRAHLREGSDTSPNESSFNPEPNNTDTSVKKYSCKICKKMFRKDYLKIHERYHTGEKPYACDICAKSFARASNLKTHKLSHTGEKPYSCEICKKRFAQTSNLKKHKRIHSGEKPYGCTTCRKVFTQWSDLETHKRTHTGANPYSCEICKMTFMQLDAIKTHKLIHTEEKARGELYAHVTKDELVLGPGHTRRPNTDNALGEKSRLLVCNYRPALDRCDDITHGEPAGTAGAEHENVQHSTFTDTLHHTVETHTYMCGTCGEIFLQKQCLIDHVKVHLRERSGTLPSEFSILESNDTGTVSLPKYTCKICKKKFRKDYLKIHERLHTGQKPHACEVCKKQFATLGSLRAHKLIHTEKRPYSCDVCAKSFVRLDHLKIHERSHTGEKPYKCETCKKGFSQLPNLQSHIRIHTGEKPYICTMCDKQFTQWSALNNHKKTHTVENTYPCEITTDPCAASETHKETHVKEDPKCESSADPCRVSETGARVNHAIKVELKLGPEGGQRRDIPIVPRAASPRCELHSCDNCNKTFKKKSSFEKHRHEAVSVKEKSECEGSTNLRRASETHKETRVKEEPKCESSADSCGVSETGASVDHVIKLELEPGNTQRPNTVNALGKKSRLLVRDYKPGLDCCAVIAHRELLAAGTAGAEQETVQHNTITETLQYTAETHAYVCGTCSEIFPQKQCLIDHLKVHLREGSDTLPNESSIREPSDTDTSVKKYSCKICKKKFRKNYLKIHERLHTGQKPHACEVCKKQFATLGSLKEHKRIHSEERPYSCDVCAKSFARLDHLKIHERSHTGEKPYKCETCKKGFSQLATLQSHIRTHTKERPYSCTICDKQFTQWSSLNKHKRSHTNEKPFSCKSYNKTFRKKSSFEKHKHEAVIVKENFECESSTDPCGASETQKETKEEPKCERSADSCRLSETGARANHVIKVGLELGPEGGQQRYIPIAPRAKSRSGVREFAPALDLRPLRTHKLVHTQEKGARSELYARDELELGPGHTQQPNTVNALGEKSRLLVRNYRPAFARCADTTHGERAGTAGAAAAAALRVHDTFTDTLHHSAETHTYKCDTCGQIFLQKQCLIDHVKVHLREGSDTLPNESLFLLEPSDTSVIKYSCKICKKMFRKDYLKIHARLHTGLKPYACEVCKKHFAAKGNLRDHKRVHTGEKPHSCNVCGKSFARLDHLKIHERIHTGQRPYKCQICNKGFSQLTNLQSHLRTHTGENPYACTICDKQFRQWSSLNKHKRSHSVENPSSCEISKKKFLELGALSVHENIHKNEKPFSCEHKHEAVSVKEKSESESSTDLCGASEAHKETRVKKEPNCESSADSCRVSETGASVDHVIKVGLELGPEGGQRRDIPIAPRVASLRCEALETASGASGAQHETVLPQDTNTDTLQATTAGTHIEQIHLTADKQSTSKRPYTCDICKKTFTQSGSLNTHKRIHTGEKPYSCEVCNKKFTARATFNNHKITAHTHVKPYPCEICNRSFKLLASLKTHGRIHTESKRYSCEICKRQFHYMSALRVHNRIHSGVKPYACEICKQHFSKKSSVETHVMHMHTRKKPFSCEVCKRQFATKGNLKYHIGTHAKDERKLPCLNLKDKLT